MNPLTEFLVYFLFTCFVVAIVCSAIRGRTWNAIVRESTHFFFMMVIGITAFSVVVYFLEWAFNRKL